MCPRWLRDNGGRAFFRLKRTARLLRIDFLVEGHAESTILHPGNSSTDRTDVTKLDRDAMPALNAQVTLAHHAAIGEIADPDPVNFGTLLDADVSQQKEAVARDAACLNPCHAPIVSLLKSSAVLPHHGRRIPPCTISNARFWVNMQ